MSILDLHAGEMVSAAANTPFVESPKTTPRFSVWGTTTAVPRGVAAGAAESTGFAAEILGAFGQVAGAYPEALGPVQLTAQQRKEAGDARAKLLTEGIDYSSEAGDLFRGVADSYKPDPLTAHTAERLVFDASRFMSKALGYSVAGGGPVLGAGLTAVDEGMAASDQLRQKGVDLTTRTEVGALAGAAAGAAVLLPVAGRTALQTAGYVAAGGPGSFIAQQAATKEILDGAGYGQIADKYDPLDPVGLAVSTLVPAAFGGLALRGRARAAKFDADTVDAARTQLQLNEQQRTSLVSDGEPGALAAERQIRTEVAGELDHPAPRPPAEIEVAQPAPDGATAAAAESGAPEAVQFEQLVQALEESHPGLRVPTEAGDLPVRQYLESAKADADAEIKFSDLVRVAADCALRNGF